MSGYSVVQNVNRRNTNYPHTRYFQIPHLHPMANILLLGYGRMGKLIEKAAVARGHQIVGKVSASTPLTEEMLHQADVAIDFSLPNIAEGLVTKAINAQVPVASGTTGWSSASLQTQVEETKRTAFIHATNMSIGVNVVFAANQLIAKLLGPTKQYTSSIAETHHIHKVDAPSGTAVTLAEGILSGMTHYADWTLDSEGDKPTAKQLPISAYREGEVFGDHEIHFESEVDQIILSHHAKSRQGFAIGAVLAAEFLIDKKGVFTMANVLGLD